MQTWAIILLALLIIALLGVITFVIAYLTFAKPVQPPQPLYTPELPTTKNVTKTT
jgi:hypothetical protein